MKLEKVKVEGSVTEDNMFKTWRKLCKRIADHPSYNDKTNIGEVPPRITKILKSSAKYHRPPVDQV